jgi:hypothetical protein
VRGRGSSRGVRPDGAGDLDATAAPPGRLPDGWQLKVNHGTPDVTVTGESSNRVLRFKSQKSSFALERGVDVDIARFPYLTWSWKVSELPVRGDFRNSSTDDQAAQVLVLFADRRSSPTFGIPLRPRESGRAPVPFPSSISSRSCAGPAPKS